LLSQPAQAISLSFSFDANDDGLSTITKTVSGVTLNLSNTNRNTGVFRATSNGIYLGRTDSFGNQFDISFDQAINFVSYQVATAQAGVAFTLSNPNGTNSTANPLSPIGTYNFNNPFTLNAGQTSTLTSNVIPFSFAGSQIQTITVDYNATPVPWETDTIPVIGSTVLFGTGIWAKRKFATRTKLG
jgi:hypothetical protein